MFRSIILFSVLITLVNCTEVQRCAGKPFPLEVRVSGCEIPPCTVIKGTTVDFEIDFVNYFQTKELTAIVRATTFGITVPYELPEEVSNVCKNLMHGAYCPLYPTEDATYKFLFYIEDIYPEIRVKVEVSLVNQDKNIVTCFVCEIKVRKGSTGGNGDVAKQIQSEVKKLLNEK